MVKCRVFSFQSLQTSGRGGGGMGSGGTEPTRGTTPTAFLKGAQLPCFHAWAKGNLQTALDLFFI